MFKSFLLGGLLAVAAGPVCAANGLGWSNSLKPKGIAAPSLTLASSGRPAYSILLPAKPDVREERAAAELAATLKQMTAATFKIVKESGSALPARYLSVGRTTALRKAALPQSQVKLNPEGLAIGQKNGNLYFFGGQRRGPLYAVTAFLEEDLGCRWYSPAVTVVPQQATLKVAVVPRTFNPKFIDERNPYYLDAFNYSDFNLRNRLSSARSRIAPELGGSMLYATSPRGEFFVHTFNQLVPKELYFKDHPEYFVMRNGVRQPDGLCETNPQVQQIALESALEALRVSPHATQLNVSRLDGVMACTCPVCKVVNTENGSDAGSLIALVNAVANGVAKEFPNVKISTIAYLDSIVPPSKLRPADNVIVRICNDMHSWKYPLLSFTEGDAPEAVKYRKVISDWAAVTKQLSVWDYTANYDHYIGPLPNLHILAPELKYYADHKVTGMMLQGDATGINSERAAMRVWVMAKLIWNPSLDTQALIRDFNYGYYGKAAAPIQAYHELLDQVSRPYRNTLLPRGIRYPMNVDFLSKDFVTKSLALFEQAESLAGNDADLLNRVQTAKLSVQYVVLQRRQDFTYAEYETALNQFSRVATLNGVGHIKEPPSLNLPEIIAQFETKLRGRPAPKFALPAAVAATLPEKIEGKNVIDVQPPFFNLWFEYELVTQIDDPLAMSGKATRTVASTNQWTVQYSMHDIDDFNDDPWHVYVMARAEPKAGAPLTGPVLSCGVYDSSKKVEIANVTKSLGEIGAGGYHLFDLGVRALNPNCFVFSAPVPNDNANAVFIERIILVREPKKVR